MLQTFVCTLKGCALTCFNDNDGALGSLLKGSSAPIDMSNVVGYTWLMVNKLSVSMLLGRVESGANIADGPSRNQLMYMQSLGASYVPAVLPDWLHSIWFTPDPGVYKRVNVV